MVDDEGLDTSVEKELGQFDCEEEGFNYVAGYIASKVHDKFPQFGVYSKDAAPGNSVPSPWIQSLSYGGLTMPSPHFLGMLKAMEDTFQHLHGAEASISEEFGILEQLVKEIKSRDPHIPQEIVKKFSVLRIYIRVKRINLAYRNAKNARRNAMKNRPFTH